MARTQIHPLTGVRGFASLWVVLHHAPNLHALSAFDLGAAGRFFEKGWLGVDLFFVLSGFVISHVYLEKMGRFTLEGAVRFLKLRLARVYPAHLIATLALVPIVLVGRTLTGYGSPTDSFSLSRLAYSLTLTNGWGFPNSMGWNQPSWSVSSEWFAYLAFPLLALVLARRRSVASSGAAALALLAGMTALGLWLSGGEQSTLLWSWSVVRVAGEFVVGCLIYDVYRQTSGGAGWDALALLALLALLVLSFAGLPPAFDFLLVLVFAALVLGLAHARGICARVFGGRALVYLGEISYSIYLIHSVVLIVLSQSTRAIGFDPETATWPAIGLVLAVFVTVSVACGQVLYRSVERPARDWLRLHWVQ